MRFWVNWLAVCWPLIFQSRSREEWVYWWCMTFVGLRDRVHRLGYSVLHYSCFNHPSRIWARVFSVELFWFITGFVRNSTKVWECFLCNNSVSGSGVLFDSSWHSVLHLDTSDPCICDVALWWSHNFVHVAISAWLLKTVYHVLLRTEKKHRLWTCLWFQHPWYRA